MIVLLNLTKQKSICTYAHANDACEQGQVWGDHLKSLLNL